VLAAVTRRLARAGPAHARWSGRSRMPDASADQPKAVRAAPPAPDRDKRLRHVSDGVKRVQAARSRRPSVGQQPMSVGWWSPALSQRPPLPQLVEGVGETAVAKRRDPRRGASQHRRGQPVPDWRTGARHHWRARDGMTTTDTFRNNIR
jgi:hypothetical protein